MNRKQRRALKARGIQMSDARTQEVIRSEYAQMCAQAGELQFKIGQFQAALKDLNSKIEALNIEYTDATKNQEAPSAEATVEAPTA